MVENIALGRDHRLRKQTTTLRDAGCTMMAICPADPSNAMVEGVTLLDYRAAPEGASPLAFLREYTWAVAQTTVRLVRAWLSPGFDVVQIAGNPDVFFPLSVILRWSGKRVVFDQRDLAPETYLIRYGRRDLLYRVLLWLERRSYRAADHVLVVNDWLRDVAIARGGVSADAVTIVSNGPRLAEVDAAEPSEDLKHGRALLVVWVGVMGPQDHVDLAIQAFAKTVSDGGIDAQLVVIGQGETRFENEALADSLGVADRVTFTGWLDPAQTFGYLATADLGLDSNLDDFVSPVKVMEYMAFGLPVVAFDLQETRILVGDGGELVPSGDVDAMAAAMARLLTDDGMRSKLGRSSRQRVEDTVAWERQAEKYLAVYRQFIPGAAASTSEP